MSLFRHYFRKESYLLFTPLAAALASLFSVAWTLYFLTAYHTYHTMAARLASLSVPKGATQVLLTPLSDVMLWFIALWCCFFMARLLGVEITTGSMRYFRAHYGQWLCAKMLAVIASAACLALPFWVAVIWLSFGTQFDAAMLAGMALAQVMMALFATLLSSAVTCFLRQALAGALLAILLLVLLWLLPKVLLSPPTLQALAAWFSPFAHAGLLNVGQFNIQTLLFIVLSSVYFISLLIWFYAKER